LRGAGGGALGVGEGEGAPDALESARQTASAKIKERCLMKLRWIGRSAGRCPPNAAAPPFLTSRFSAAATGAIHRAHLRRRFARCQKFPYGRSSFRPERDFP
jgi:hypothetical protein